jgi:hypothetical protein
MFILIFSVHLVSLIHATYSSCLISLIICNFLHKTVIALLVTFDSFSAVSFCHYCVVSCLCRSMVCRQHSRPLMLSSATDWRKHQATLCLKFSFSEDFREYHC